ncbi:MAG: hypothetical protein PVF05_00230 [Gemmatimonadales bacterium]
MIDPGLCANCRWARVVTSDRGTRFWLCRAAAWRDDLRRYPQLPVLRCPGFERGAPDGPPDTDGDSGC